MKSRWDQGEIKVDHLSYLLSLVSVPPPAYRLPSSHLEDTWTLGGYLDTWRIGKGEVRIFVLDQNFGFAQTGKKLSVE